MHNYQKDITIRNCKFAFKCEERWAYLQTTEDDNVRFCDSCQQQVFFCKTDDELLIAIKNNRCVSIESLENLEIFVGKPLATK